MLIHVQPKFLHGHRCSYLLEQNKEGTKSLANPYIMSTKQRDVEVAVATLHRVHIYSFVYIYYVFSFARRGLIFHVHCLDQMEDWWQMLLTFQYTLVLCSMLYSGRYKRTCNPIFICIIRCDHKVKGCVIIYCYT